jgi:DNA polymerase III subunit chi
MVKMTEIFFYHLEQHTIDKFLPPLLEKILDKGWKALVICSSEHQMTDLNEKLWTYSDDSFLPHGVIEEGFPEEQPVLLVTSFQNINQSEACVLFAEAEKYYDLKEFQRVLYAFSGEDQRLIARKAWVHYKAQGYSMSYWKQDALGHWKKEQ